MRRARGRGNAPRFWFGASSVSIEHKGGEGYMVVQTKVCMKREHNFLNFFPSFFWVCCADSFLIILAEADANTWNGIKSLL